MSEMQTTGVKRLELLMDRMGFRVETLELHLGSSDKINLELSRLDGTKIYLKTVGADTWLIKEHTEYVSAPSGDRRKMGWVTTLLLRKKTIEVRGGLLQLSNYLADNYGETRQVTKTALRELISEYL